MIDTQQSVEILAYCTQFMEETLAFNQTLYALARLAFILALVLATAHVVIALVGKWRKDKAEAAKLAAEARALREASDGTLPEGVTRSLLPTGELPGPDVLKALTGLLDSLAKAPVWFFLFLGGMALVWLADLDVPEVCLVPLQAEDGVASNTGSVAEAASESGS